MGFEKISAIPILSNWTLKIGGDRFGQNHQKMRIWLILNHKLVNIVNGEIKNFNIKKDRLYLLFVLVCKPMCNMVQVWHNILHTFHALYGFCNWKWQFIPISGVLLPTWKKYIYFIKYFFVVCTAKNRPALW